MKPKVNAALNLAACQQEEDENNGQLTEGTSVIKCKFRNTEDDIFIILKSAGFFLG